MGDSPPAVRLRTSLEHYARIKSAAVPAPEPTGKLLSSYDLEASLDRYRSWLKLDTEWRAEMEEVDWERSLLEQDRIHQSRKRGEYLKLADNDLERFEKGLSLMLDRCALETRSLELSLQQNRMKQAETRLGRLKNELDQIPQVFSADTSSLAAWKEKYEQANESLTAMKSTVAEPKQSTGPAKAGIPASSESRRSILVAMKSNLDVALAEVESRHAGLVVSLIETSTLPASEIDLGHYNELFSDYPEWSGGIVALLDRSRRTIERIRNATGEQLAAVESDASQSAFLRETLAMADTTEQAQHRLFVEHGTAGFVASVLEARLQEAEGWVGQVSTRTKGFFSNTWSKMVLAIRYPLFEINETPVNGLGLFRVLLVLFAAWWMSKFIRHGLQRFGSKQKKVSKTSLYTVERIVHYVVIAIGIMIGLSSIGLDLTKFALFASALGVGLGFGLQNLVSNFVAGLIVLFEKGLNVGDFVELESGVWGEVKEINMRSTLIRTNDNVDILVPNSEFVSGRVTNWTLREAYRRIHVPFGVAYGTDKELVKKAVLEATERVPWTLNDVSRREPQVWLVGFGDSSLDFELVVWLTPEAVKRPGVVQSDFLWEIETSLGEHGIEIPFPQRDLHIRSGLERIHRAEAEAGSSGTREIE